MGADGRSATQGGAQAIASGMRVFADYGPATSAMQHAADEIGVSQSYVFRLFGIKHRPSWPSWTSWRTMFSAPSTNRGGLADVPLQAMVDAFRGLDRRALVVLLQSLGVNPTAGSRAAVASLHAQRTRSP
jgi:hypothetical protein